MGKEELDSLGSCKSHLELTLLNRDIGNVLN